MNIALFKNEDHMKYTINYNRKLGKTEELQHRKYIKKLYKKIITNNNIKF